MSTTEEIREGFYLGENDEWIPDGWAVTRIGDVGSVVTGKTPAKANPHHWGDRVDFITPTDYTNSRTLRSVARKLSKDGEDAFSRQITKAGSIAVSCIGSDMGKVILTKERSLTNQQINTLTVSDSHHNLFWYYRIVQAYPFLRSIAEGGGSTMPIVNKGQFENIQLMSPLLPEQKAIAAVLGSLDDKIELFREQNETLEALAQTLFKRWFIDFNFPDENGNPYKDSGGKMVASELGEIPEGWKVAELQEIIALKKSGIRSDAIGHEVKYVGLEHIPRKHLQLTEHGWGKDVSSNKTEFSRGDILFGKLRPYFHKVCIAPFEGICSTDILVLNVVTEFWYSFALMHIYSERLIDFVTLASTGTRMPRTNFSEIGRYKVPLPPQGVAEPFDEMCRRFFEKASDNTEQIETLIQLRDTLLPKLMKGEIRVPTEQ